MEKYTTAETSKYRFFFLRTCLSILVLIPLLLMVTFLFFNFIISLKYTCVHILYDPFEVKFGKDNVSQTVYTNTSITINAIDSLLYDALFCFAFCAVLHSFLLTCILYYSHQSTTRLNLFNMKRVKKDLWYITLLLITQTYWIIVLIATIKDELKYYVDYNHSPTDHKICIATTCCAILYYFLESSVILSIRSDLRLRLKKQHKRYMIQQTYSITDDERRPLLEDGNHNDIGVRKKNTSVYETYNDLGQNRHRGRGLDPVLAAMPIFLILLLELTCLANCLTSVITFIMTNYAVKTWSGNVAWMIGVIPLVSIGTLKCQNIHAYYACRKFTTQSCCGYPDADMCCGSVKCFPRSCFVYCVCVYHWGCCCSSEINEGFVVVRKAKVDQIIQPEVAGHHIEAPGPAPDGGQG